MQENEVQENTVVEMREQVLDEAEQQNAYQVFVTHLSFSKDSTKAFRSKYSAKCELPEELSFNIPDTKLEKIRKSSKTDQEFKDQIETYVYDALTHKFMHEVQHAQIWLPPED